MNAIDCCKKTPLHCVKTESIAKFFLEAGADVNARDLVGNTPLYQAKTEGIAKVLLEAGADVNDTNYYTLTPLFYSIDKNYSIEHTKLLLESGANIENDLDLLHFVSNVEQAKVLLDAGADVNARDNHDKTPLHYAKNEEIKKFLIMKGGVL